MIDNETVFAALQSDSTLTLHRMVNMCRPFQKLEQHFHSEKTLLFPFNTNFDAINNRFDEEVEVVKKPKKKKLIHFDILKTFHSIRDE